MTTLLVGAIACKGLAKINYIFANLSRTICLLLSWVYAQGNAIGLYFANCNAFVTLSGNDFRIDASNGASRICPPEGRWRAQSMILAYSGQRTVSAWHVTAACKSSERQEESAGGPPR